jgi:HTH-type transcriptional regulator/antitoxin HigA
MLRGTAIRRSAHDADPTLVVIQNDAEHAEAKALVEKLMGSKDPADQARIAAQARLIEAYERAR